MTAVVPIGQGVVVGGRYELRDRIGSATWIATDRVLARTVVVETLGPSTPPNRIVAFARLSHPAIVTTYDSGVADGVPYVVTERPAGKPLAAVLPLPENRAVGIGSQLAHALAAAHRAGVVHGSFDAESVTVGEDDRVKVAGFARAPNATPLNDVHALGSVLRGAVAGGGSAALTTVLDAAADGGTIADAEALAAALDALEVAQDPDADTPPMGVLLGTTPPLGGGRTSMVAGIVVGLVLVIAIGIAAFALVNSSGGGSGNQSGSGGRSDGLTIAGAHSFNPLGDKTENEQAAAKAIDGDTSTVWSTSDYKTEKFGNLKSGTGIFVSLDARHALHQLTVTSPSIGWTFSVYVADQPATDLIGWGSPVTGPETVTSSVTQVDLTGNSGGAILVWITDLGPPNSNSGLAGYPYRVDIGELAVR